ncbi:MAG TPA: helix-turn-helix domain-containing protein [Candidatus Cloacimonadota bacterium]|nr:helix-turn-helix domain-containing protein [Candidatus Cloacimonadota bacterium]
MENLGKYLADLRLKRDLSLSKIQEDMHFPPEKIKALEAGDLEQLGEYGMRKAMIFNYARYLEADLNAVMAEFKRLDPDPAQKSIPSFMEKDKKILLSTNFLWMIAIFVIVVILGSIVWYAYSQGVLKTPVIFSKAGDSLKVAQTRPREEAAPDSLRERMLMLSNEIKTGKQIDSAKERAQKAALPPDYIPADTTDHIGRLLGKSPVNVPIH